MNRAGAISGMLAGILFTFAYITYFQFLEGTPDQYLFGITPEGIGFIGMLLNFLVAFSVAAFTKPVPDYVVEMVENIHIPAGAAKAERHDYDI